MIRLLYISQAVPTLTGKDVNDILLASQRNNATFGISGVLVFGGRIFAQVLEGPEHNVLRQYVRIVDDRRHGDCHIVHITPTDTRMFEQWSMAVIEGDPLELQYLAELRARRVETVRTTEFTRVMQSFLARLDNRKARAA